MPFMKGEGRDGFWTQHEEGTVNCKAAFEEGERSGLEVLPAGRPVRVVALLSLVCDRALGAHGSHPLTPEGPLSKGYLQPQGSGSHSNTHPLACVVPGDLPDFIVL